MPFKTVLIEDMANGSVFRKRDFPHLALFLGILNQECFNRKNAAYVKGVKEKIRAEGRKIVNSKNLYELKDYVRLDSYALSEITKEVFVVDIIPQIFRNFFCDEL